ncbi:diguanylate cyclase (GGDEF)-like protein [Okibacterium sp. HSC-33S16]|uniref:GGDEF domain-containing protein n=1 Tax=Okibacterium sp. HSC-33S16 TaxID=2910965 RepID=UPI0020A1EB9E|nr:diguanylate cyclase [Okibacterium sp. HSC-33S16]MCP2032056.1 diguanylate cyclase (GGDEF)-like protein [Okibacterium sp. HSC-33S16]
MIRTLLGGLICLNLPTLLLSSGLVVTVCGLIFIIGSVAQHHDRASRLWSAAFTFGILAMVSFAVWSVLPDSPAIIGVGNGSLTLAMGLIWSGSRAYNGRQPFGLLSFAGALVVAILAWVDGENGSWAGGQAFLIGVAVFAALAGVEAFSGRMRRSINAHILAVVMCAVGVFFAIRAVVFAISGPYSDVFLGYLDTDITTFVTVLFVVTASTSMNVLRTEGTSPRGSRTVDVEQWEHFRPRESFANEVNDRLERLARSGAPGVLARVEIDNLAEMNTAFGRSFSDSAMTLVGAILRDEVSASAVLGHSGGAGFDALLFGDLDSALDCAKRVRAALVDMPIDVSQGLRVSVTIALAVPESGEKFAALSERAAGLVADGHAAGGNLIVGHPEEDAARV